MAASHTRHHDMMPLDAAENVEIRPNPPRVRHVTTDPFMIRSKGRPGDLRSAIRRRGPRQWFRRGTTYRRPSRRVGRRFRSVRPCEQYRPCWVVQPGRGVGPGPPGTGTPVAVKLAVDVGLGKIGPCGDWSAVYSLSGWVWPAARTTTNPAPRRPVRPVSPPRRRRSDRRQPRRLSSRRHRLKRRCCTPGRRGGG